MIELFAVPPESDEPFLAAWAAEAPPGATLYRALRADVPYRFASLPSGGGAGVRLIVPLADDSGWDAVLGRLAGCQGFIGAELDDLVAVIRWSSPLMYQRAGNVLAGLRCSSPPALYVTAST